MQTASPRSGVESEWPKASSACTRCTAAAAMSSPGAAHGRPVEPSRYRVLVCTARTLNAGSSRIGSLYSTIWELNNSLGTRQEGRGGEIRPKQTMLAGLLCPRAGEGPGGPAAAADMRATRPAGAGTRAPGLAAQGSERLRQKRQERWQKRQERADHERHTHEGAVVAARHTPTLRRKPWHGPDGTPPRGGARARERGRGAGRGLAPAIAARPSALTGVRRRAGHAAAAHLVGARCVEGESPP